jgi:DNA-binding beta-propeller fold protein YncE
MVSARMRRRRIRAAILAAGLLTLLTSGIVEIVTPDAPDRASANAVAAPPMTGTQRSVADTSTLSAPRVREDVYANTRAGMFTPVTRLAKPAVYVPDSRGNGVYVINPKTYKVSHYLHTGPTVQHVVPAWNLGTLYATNDHGNSLTPIDPETTRRSGPNIDVKDPYNLYFTPDGQHAIVVEEAKHALAFRDPNTMALQRRLHVPCRGIDHMDFSADGRFAYASCEFSATLLRIDLARPAVTGRLRLGGSPQDVKLAPNGRTLYVANRYLGGVQLVDTRTLRLRGFRRTALDAHGLYVSRNGQDLYVTNRSSGTISVLSFATNRIVATWRVRGGSPDMGGVSADGKVFWVAGRYDGAVYAISTRTGRVIAKIRVGVSPHGLCLWPQPGRYSTGHTGVMR